MVFIGNVRGKDGKLHLVKEVDDCAYPIFDSLEILKKRGDKKTMILDASSGIFSCYDVKVAKILRDTYSGSLIYNILVDPLNDFTPLQGWLMGKKLKGGNAEPWCKFIGESIDILIGMAENDSQKNYVRDDVAYIFRRYEIPPGLCGYLAKLMEDKRETNWRDQFPHAMPGEDWVKKMKGVIFW